MSPAQKKNKISVPGLVLTLLATAGFVWAANQWFNQHNWPPKPTPEGIRANEIETLKNLQRIAGAQEEYRKKDWDEDGRKTYAKFLAHLWSSVNTKSRPVPVGLISQDLAFAMGAGQSLDGYYFVDLHTRRLPEGAKMRKLDYEIEWALAAVPAEPGKTGILILIADNSSRVYAKNQNQIPSDYPHDPAAAGWKEIQTVGGLQNLQKTIEYPPK